MTEKQNNTKQFIRGGQITLHNLRMFNQIAHKVFLIGLLLFLCLMIAWFVWDLSAYSRYLTGQWLWAKFNSGLLGAKATQQIVQPNGHRATVYSSVLLASPLMQQTLSLVVKSVWQGLLYCLIACGVILFGVVLFLKQRGRAHTNNERLKGDYLATPLQVTALIKQKQQASNLTLGKEQVPLVKNSETQHFLIHGTTGAGKSTAIKALLTSIRARGDRVIFWDEGGNFIREFFQPKTDHIFNDLDERGLCWHLWDECSDIADFESLATALIPMTGAQDPFWVLGARTIFSEVAFQMREDPSRSVQKLLKTLLTTSLENIKSMLENTYASTLVSDKIEKTAISIKSIMAAYLKCLRYVKEGDNPFSIRRWIQNEAESGWLYFSSLEKKHEALKPLITARLDIAINELLSLSELSQRRIWIVLDELTSLHQIPTLLKILSKGRKPGACVLVGVQNYAQLAQTYGIQGAKIISALLNTRLFFRQPDFEMASWSAQSLGQTELNEAKEGISYGANTLRDGVSINRQDISKPVVTPSEIMRLPDLACFLRLPGPLPISQITLAPPIARKIAKGFIERRDTTWQNPELENLIATHEKAGVALMQTDVKANEQKTQIDLLFDI